MKGAAVLATAAWRLKVEEKPLIPNKHSESQFI
jgi:hypothetical protein